MSRVKLTIALRQTRLGVDGLCHFGEESRKEAQVKLKKQRSARPRAVLARRAN